MLEPATIGDGAAYNSGVFVLTALYISQYESLACPLEGLLPPLP